MAATTQCYRNVHIPLPSSRQGVITHQTVGYLLEESYENTHLNVTVEDDCNEYGRPMATIITFDDGAWSCTVRLRDELTNTSTEPTNDDGYDHDPHTEGMEVFVTPTKAIEIVANAPDPHRTYLRDYHALVTLLRQLA